MAGFDAPYVPGWDCHGLPIEIKVDNELGKKKASMTPVEIRAACRKYAEKFVDIHREQFQRLGVSGPLGRPVPHDEPRSTRASSPAPSSIFWIKGYVYKGLKPVHWCPHCRTALAEAEVEYEDHTSPSIWVRFALTSDPAAIDPALAGRKVCGPDLDHDALDHPGQHGHRLPSEVCLRRGGRPATTSTSSPRSCSRRPPSACGWIQHDVIARFPGAQLEGAVFRHPFLDRDSPGILADHVTLEQGTGAVHTAPGHGQEDYVVGQQYGIDDLLPGGLPAAASSTPRAPTGKLPEEIDRPDRVGRESGGGRTCCASPARCSPRRRSITATRTAGAATSPTIFRATEQWFIGMERNDLRHEGAGGHPQRQMASRAGARSASRT